MVVTAEITSGGAERVISILLNKWVEQSVNCDLVLLNKTSHFYPISSEVHIDEIGKLHSNHYFDKLLKYYRVRCIAQERKPDIILAMPEEYGIYVLGFMLGTHIPVVVSERNNPWVMPNKKITRILRKALYPLAKGFIFQSEEAAGYFKKNIREKSVILKNPMNLPQNINYSINQNNKLIVGIGRLEQQKNFRLLIDAFHLFYQSHPQYKLLIVGEGSQRVDLEKHAAQLLPQHVYDFPGKVSDIYKVLVNASVYVLSSNYEGLPNALLEAMAIGVPVVSTDYAPGSVKTIVKNGFNGLIVPRNDPVALSEAISSICDNKSFAYSLSNNSKAIGIEYNATEVSKNWLKYLERLV